eukprot:Tamp_14616.p1 GENE.Tamp_14616~~Tamp_14616.p1  ORF type:complete len:477 (+),score=22.15 Tamp_14616:171-1433(+)
MVVKICSLLHDGNEKRPTHTLPPRQTPKPQNLRGQKHEANRVRRVHAESAQGAPSSHVQAAQPHLPLPGFPARRLEGPSHHESQSPAPVLQSATSSMKRPLSDGKSVNQDPTHRSWRLAGSEGSLPVSIQGPPGIETPTHRARAPAANAKGASWAGSSQDPTHRSWRLPGSSRFHNDDEFESLCSGGGGEFESLCSRGIHNDDEFESLCSGGRQDLSAVTASCALRMSELSQSEGSLSIQGPPGIKTTTHRARASAANAKGASWAGSSQDPTHRSWRLSGSEGSLPMSIQGPPGIKTTTHRARASAANAKGASWADSRQDPTHCSWRLAGSEGSLPVSIQGPPGITHRARAPGANTKGVGRAGKHQSHVQANHIGASRAPSSSSRFYAYVLKNRASGTQLGVTGTVTPTAVVRLASSYPE